MAKHYKMAINGVVGTQQIVNVMYAGTFDGTDVEQSIEAYDDLVAAWVAQVKTPYMQAQTGAYTIVSMGITVVDEIGTVWSTFPYEAPLSGTGVRGGSIDGAGRTGIMALRCNEAYSGQTSRVPKRSYLAIGPVPTEDIGVDSRITTAYNAILQTLGNAIASFNAIVGASAYNVTSTRVGVANKDGIGAEGQVVLAVPRPYATNRKSRTVSPMGN